MLMGRGNSETWECFEDKSKFVKLPCSPDADYFTVDKYCTEDGYFNEPTKREIWDCEICEVSCDKVYKITRHKFSGLKDLVNKLEGIGKTYYLSEDDAKKKLEILYEENADTKI